ncbi:bifunctional UDP-N-acetylglucosamine diphosphorylase/glucosamine-1-phosphate N-acetyltransferase GlmU [Aestuariispira insulae]|nr:bifunctional UDP-N-acetylglucosamine diphosphorylase/glucosamine-1-phosphate N-acetyltransferase GlmU [Aestuariispira insulae]
MTGEPRAVVVLGAGKGTRMKSALPKVLHKIAGRTMISHALDAASVLKPERTVVVVGPGMDNVAAEVAPFDTAIQHGQSGTADALKAAVPSLKGFDQGTVIVLFGDSPFITAETLANMVAAREAGASAVVLGFEPADPTGYGRLVLDDADNLTAIVEHKECTQDQLRIGLCNSGFMALDAATALPLLNAITNDNAKGEYYLTDIVSLCVEAGHKCSVIKASEDELLGVNSRADLARAEKIWQDKRRLEAMDNGVTLTSPESVFFAYDTQLGTDVIIEPHVVFGPNVTVGNNVTIKAFSHLEGAQVGDGADIGPYARLREGSVIGKGARVGNFVETKKCTLGDGAKANHLSYLGDAEIGARANIGAGTITCNYDGFLKSKTWVGEAAFIGSNTSLVAPVSIGDGAITGAGSVITRDVSPDAIAVERGEQKMRPGAATEYRAAKKALRDAQS